MTFKGLGSATRRHSPIPPMAEESTEHLTSQRDHPVYKVRSAAPRECWHML